MSAQPNRFYFGVGERESGHGWWVPGARERHVRLAGLRTRPDWGIADAPFNYEVDGRLQPSGALKDEQGPCNLWHRAGWSALAWWDRSGPDKRPGCCSCFVMRGEHAFDAMVSAFRESFPWAAARMGFELRLHEMRPAPQEPKQGCEAGPAPEVRR